MIVDIVVSETGSLKMEKSCFVERSLKWENKGLEGVQHIVRKSGSGENHFLLGLCEGNFCMGGKRGRMAGNGHILIMKRRKLETGAKGCSWVVQKEVLKIPSVANFIDYSAIHIHPESRKVAITSQESSAVWIGTLHETEWKFENEGKVYHFPRSPGVCAKLYCNIEGVQWIGEYTLVAVSDKMKGRGKQDASCLWKDQSIHLFQLP